MSKEIANLMQQIDILTNAPRTEDTAVRLIQTAVRLNDIEASCIGKDTDERGVLLVNKNKFASSKKMAIGGALGLFAGLGIGAVLPPVGCAVAILSVITLVAGSSKAELTHALDRRVDTWGKDEDKPDMMKAARAQECAFYELSKFPRDVISKAFSAVAAKDPEKQHALIVTRPDRSSRFMGDGASATRFMIEHMPSFELYSRMLKRTQPKIAKANLLQQR